LDHNRVYNWCWIKHESSLMPRDFVHRFNLRFFSIYEILKICLPIYISFYERELIIISPAIIIVRGKHLLIISTSDSFSPRTTSMLPSFYIQDRNCYPLYSLLIIKASTFIHCVHVPDNVHMMNKWMRLIRLCSSEFFIVCIYFYDTFYLYKA